MTNPTMRRNLSAAIFLFVTSAGAAAQDEPRLVRSRTAFSSKLYAPRTKRPLRTDELVDKAITRGLDWLAAHQDEDGRWDCDGFGKHDAGRAGARVGAGNPAHDVGVTGLALLAFLAEGSTPEAGAYREQIVRGIAWLRSQQGAIGLFGENSAHHFIYGHAIATYAVCEAYARSTDDALAPVAQAGIDYLEQHRNPGSVWRYQPNYADNDLSVTSWCLAAYCTALDAGLDVNQEALRIGAEFLRQVSDSTGKHGYTRQGEDSPRITKRHRSKFPTERGEALTAAGLFIRFLLHQDQDDHPVMEASAKLIGSKPPVVDKDGGSIDFCHWYYGTHAMHQVGGRAWSQWWRPLTKALLGLQRRDGVAAGSWDARSVWGDSGGRVYATAMAVLSLRAPNRHASISKLILVERRAQKELDKVRATYEAKPGDARRLTYVKQRLKKLIEKWGDTRAGKEATQWLLQLR